MSELFDKETNAGWTKYEKKDEGTQVSALDDPREEGICKTLPLI